MIVFILLVPLLVAILAIALAKDYKNAKYIALAGSVLSLALFPFIDSNAIEYFEWFSINHVQVALSTSTLPLNSLLLMLVLLIGSLVIAYSGGFIDLPSEQRRFYIEILAFEVSMLAFAMAANFIVLFIAWEFLSLTSYLLIGFWYDRDRAIAAARKAITIILIGDIALLASIVMFQSTFGSLQFTYIISNIGSSSSLIPVALLLVAIMAKSAQFPLQEWLPDAMEGPTPVSAFLHSTTMVKAGVFVAIVLFPLFAAAQILNVMLAVGAITTVVGVFGALRENHVKRVLAYSTVQELGLMLVAVASGALLAAVYFFFAQSFYKALLFFSAGATIKATGKEDITEITGLKQNKLIYISTLFGVLSLAGFVPFDGFFANIGLGSAFSTNLLVYAFISLVGFASSFYIFRWMVMQTRKSGGTKIALNYNSTPRSMSYSMGVLAICTLAASAVFFFTGNIIPTLGNFSLGNINMLDVGLELGLAAIGAYSAYVIYRQGKSSSLKNVRPEVLFNRVFTATATNAAYKHFADFVGTFAESFAHIDYRLNNAFDWTGHLVIRFSSNARNVASGSINAYVALFVAGVLILILLVVAF